jgi:hypothetical protein
MNSDDADLLLAIGANGGAGGHNAVDINGEGDHAVENDEESDPYVHPYIWKCVDVAISKGAGM